LQKEIDGEKKKKVPSNRLVNKNTEDIRKLTAEKKRLQDNLKQRKINDREQQTTDDLRVRFYGKKGNDFTPEERAMVFKYAKKNYIDRLDNTVTAYNDTINGVAKDLGLTPTQVRSIFDSSRGLKKITDERYVSNKKVRDMRTRAKMWMDEEEKSFIGKTIGKLPRAVFALRILGHGGGVPLVTHAGLTFFQNPIKWTKYFLKSFQFAYGDISKYEQQKADLSQRPNYFLAQKNGLANDITQLTDDYAKYAATFSG
jgi:hypothetical protein